MDSFAESVLSACGKRGLVPYRLRRLAPLSIYNKVWVSATEACGDVTIPANGRISQEHLWDRLCWNVLPLESYGIRPH